MRRPSSLKFVPLCSWSAFAVFVVVLCSAVVGAQQPPALGGAPASPRLGQPISEADVAPWNIDIMPDGSGLPAGSGRPEAGGKIYATKCAACHGPMGKGGIDDELVGDWPLDGPGTEKTIGNFWPYSTTLFDYIRRAMPWQAPQTLTNDEVYALTAYLLSLNKVIGAQDVMNAQTLPKVRMPNRDGFIPRFPDLTP